MATTLKQLIEKYGEEWIAHTVETVLRQREKARERAKKEREEFRKFQELKKQGKIKV